MLRNLCLLISILSIGLLSAQEPFVTTWETKVANDSIVISINPDAIGETVKYDVIWGDGTMDIEVDGDITHTYGVPGEHVIKINGSFPGIQVDLTSGNAAKLRSIDQWGDIQWKTMMRAFDNANLMVYAATDTPDLSDVTRMDRMFSRAKNFNGNINSWDVSNIEFFNSLFAGAEEFDQPLNSWNTAKAINMSAVFAGATSFDQDLSNWVLDSVTNVERMFSFTGFNQDISMWDVSGVTNFSGLFDQNDEFNQPIGSWKLTSAEDMSRMFQGATKFNQSIDLWETTTVTNMAQLFTNAVSFDQSLNSWDVSNVTEMYLMFAGADSFNQPLDDWDVSNVEDMERMFDDADSFNQNLGDWEINNISSLERALDSTAISVENLDATILGWAEASTTPDDVRLGLSGLSFCTSRTDITTLVIEKGWTVIGATLWEGCDVCENSAKIIFYHTQATNNNIWSNPFMWSTGGLPEPCDDVVINNNFNVQLDVDGVAGTLEIASGSGLEVDGFELSVTGSTEN